ncbi:MAG TPA: DUF4344 domain-containing metallopeptidase, partial [Thermoanaerobaculia bacterium]|nr:DUF4344 domain-containing metallopeptidase [Thermoanaerobaculia bacterium]
MTDSSVRCCALAFALLALAACGPIPEEEAMEAADTGDFIVKYEATENEDYQELEAILKEVRLLEDTVQELNGTFSLPSEVPVVIRECGEVNAFYDPE